MILVES